MKKIILCCVLVSFCFACIEDEDPGQPEPISYTHYTQPREIEARMLVVSPPFMNEHGHEVVALEWREAQAPVMDNDDCRTHGIGCLPARVWHLFPAKNVPTAVMDQSFPPLIRVGYKLYCPDEVPTVAIYRFEGIREIEPGLRAPPEPEPTHERSHIEGGVEPEPAQPTFFPNETNNPPK